MLEWLQASLVAGLGVWAACSGATSTPRVTQLHDDEELLLFPAMAAYNEQTATWHGELSAWIYEPEHDSVRRKAALSAFAAALDLEGTAANEVFWRRARLFLVDNESDKRAVVAFDEQRVVLPATADDGRVSVTTSWRGAPVTRPTWTPIVALFPPTSPRAAHTRLVKIPPRGLSLVSDIDDTLKVTHVRDRQRMLTMTFLEEFVAIEGMPERVRTWADAGAAIHYVSGSPWALFPELEEFFVRVGLPLGTFHLKQVRVWDGGAAALFADPMDYKVREIVPLLQRFPERQFVLLGDSGEADPEAYAALYATHAAQIAAILIRNVDGSSAERERCEHVFRDVPRARWQVFTHASELPASLAQFAPAGP